MKSVFFKVTGVTPEELAALHALYEDGRRQHAEHKVNWLCTDSCNSSDGGFPIVAEIVSSKLDKDYNTYTVEFRLDALMTDIVPWKPRRLPNSGELFGGLSEQQPHGDWELRPGLNVLRRIWDVLGIFPAEEQFIKVRD